MIIIISPGKDINSYIAQLDKLKSAINYFLDNGKSSDGMQNVGF